MVQRMIVLWLSLIAILVAAQECYDVNGTVATSGFAENSRKLWKACPNSTTCCLTGGESEDSCFTGGMCFSSTGAAFYRGMCTDQDWASGSGCPNQCLHLTNDANTWINACGDHWCCAGWAGSGNDCCNSGNLTFRHGEYSAIVTAIANTTETGSASRVTVTEGVVTYTNIVAPDGYVDQKIVIGLGTGLGVALLCALAAVVFLLCAGRRRPALAPTDGAYSPISSTQATTSPLPHGHTYSYSSAGGQSAPKRAGNGTTTGSELDSHKPAVEMYTAPERYEVPS